MFSCHSCSPSHGNMLYTLDNPGVVDDYLQKELSDGNIMEVVDPTGVLARVSK